MCIFLFCRDSFGRTLDGIAAVVADEPVLLSEVLSLQKQVSSNPALAKVYELPTTASKRAVLEKLIESKIISITLKEIGAEVGPEDVEKQIASIASQNGISKSQLENSLRSEKVNLDIYKQNIKSQLEKRAIFDRQLRQSGSNPSEAELRSLYNQQAGKEVNLLLIDAAAGAPSSKKKALSDEWKKIVAQVESKKLSYDDAKKQLTPYSLDWVGVKSLHPSIEKVVKDANPGSILGPVMVDGRPTVVFFEAVRSGSEDGFEKMRPQLESQLRSQGFDNRLAQWLERRKKELQIVVNEI